MSRNAREQGVPLAANVLASSVGRAIDLLDPVVRHITHKTLTSACVSFDATGLPILDDEHPMGIRAGAMWGLIGDDRWATFVPAPSGHGVHLERRIAGYALAIAMCDGSATNNVVEGPTTKRGGCNSHARSKLVESLRGGDARAIEGIEIYAQLFAIEAESKRRREDHAQRLERRQRESAPVVQRLANPNDRHVLHLDDRRAAVAVVRHAVGATGAVVGPDPRLRFDEGVGVPRAGLLLGIRLDVAPVAPEATGRLKLLVIAVVIDIGECRLHPLRDEDHATDERGELQEVAEQVRLRGRRLRGEIGFGHYHRLSRQRLPKNANRLNIHCDIF